MMRVVSTDGLKHWRKSLSVCKVGKNQAHHSHFFFVRVHTYYERYVLKEKFAIAYFDPRPVLSSLQVSRSFTENLLVIFM